MKHVIYKIYWPYKGFYFGKTKGYRKRRNRHLREMKDGSHHNRNLVEFFALYGKPVIKIIIRCDCDAELTRLEKDILLLHKDNKRCLNIQKQ